MKGSHKILIGGGIALGALAVLGCAAKPASVYQDEPEEQNPMEGKRVALHISEEDEVNADGVRGHLEACGTREYREGFYERCVKRGLDLALSGAGLVMLSPVLALISLLIVIDDPGPVLFTQKRVGRNKQYFRMHKFRSMRMSTPHDVPTHQLEHPEEYITPIGRLLRRTSLDELPQIWDIWLGNMSVIGPRPALWNQGLLVAERDRYGANDCRPGLTGLAQINGRDELLIADKARYDGRYAEILRLGGWRAFRQDAACFFGTIRSVLCHDGVVEGGTGQKRCGRESQDKSPDYKHHTCIIEEA